MRRPHGSDDHCVGDEVEAWREWTEDLDGGELGEALTLAVEVRHALCVTWDRRSVARAFGVSWRKVEVVYDSPRWLAERAVWAPGCRTVEAWAKRGWCVELLTRGRL